MTESAEQSLETYIREICSRSNRNQSNNVQSWSTVPPPGGMETLRLLLFKMDKDRRLVGKSFKVTAVLDQLLKRERAFSLFASTDDLGNKVGVALVWTENT